MKIRPFTPSDQQATKKLILNGLQAYWGELDPTLNQDLTNIAESYRAGCFLVADLGGEIVGCGALLPRSSQKGEIVRMSVHEKMRRVGIGRKILDALLEEARARGYLVIILETTATWDEAIAFYKSYGFQATHIVDGDQYFEYRFEK